MTLTVMFFYFLYVVLSNHLICFMNRPTLCKENNAWNVVCNFMGRHFLILDPVHVLNRGPETGYPD